MDYPVDDVLKAIHYTDGVGEKDVRYNVLDINDRKIGELSAATGNVSLDSTAAIQRKASFQIDEGELYDIDYSRDRIQPFYRIRMPDGGYFEKSLGIFIINSPSKSLSGGIKSRNVNGFDKNLILDQQALTTTKVLSIGDNVTNRISSLIAETGITKIEITPSSAISNIDKVVQLGANRLLTIDEMFAAINYKPLFIDEFGFAKSEPYLSPKDKTIRHIYQDNELSILSEDAEEVIDYFNIPNVITVICTNPQLNELLYHVAKNENPESPTSIPRRGRIISQPPIELNNVTSQAELDKAAIRILTETSQIYSNVKFETAVNPLHGISDIIYLQYKLLDISAKFEEISWEIDLSPEGKMSHEARRVVNIE